MSSGLALAGITAQRAVTTGTIFLDDLTFPQMNVYHQAQGGSIALSAGPNPSQGFTVQQTAVGNSQIFGGPNFLVSNVLQVPQTALIGTANVSNNLNVTGNFVSNGSSIVGNTLFVANTVNTPILHSNLVTTSALTATGPLANSYIETFSNSSSQSSGLYLSSAWRVKAISSGGLAFQSYFNQQWNNVSVLAPTGISLTIAQLTSPTT